MTTYMSDAMHRKPMVLTASVPPPNLLVGDVIVNHPDNPDQSVEWVVTTKAVAGGTTTITYVGPDAEPVERVFSDPDVWVVVRARLRGVTGGMAA